MTAGRERRADMDWARLALLLATFLYRSARSWALTPASTGDWAVALLRRNLPDIVDLCSIGLFLFLSGASIRAALERQGAGTSCSPESSASFPHWSSEPCSSPRPSRSLERPGFAARSRTSSYAASRASTA